MLTIEVNGVEYKGFLSATASLNFLALCSTFSFVATQSDGQTFPLKAGQNCKVYADSTEILNGYIEVISPSYSSNSYTINISGRDQTCDVVDSQLGDKNVEFTGTISLVEVTKRILKLLGINKTKTIMSVSTTIPNLAPFTTADIEAASVGQSAFAFLENLARLRQVIMTSDGNGNIVFARGSTQQIKTALLHDESSPQNNVISGSANIDFSKRFNKYVAWSQNNNSASVFGDGELSPESSMGLSASVVDNQIREGRVLNFIAENASDLDDLKTRAQWECNFRRAQSYEYKCTVAGHTATKDGFIWRPNLLVYCKDIYEDLDSQLLIKEVNFITDDNGDFTDLTLVTSDAFTLEANRTKKSKNANKIAIDFTKGDKDAA